MQQGADPMRKLTLLFAAIALQAPLWLGAAPSAQARTLFDGQWSVSIVTDAGDTCDRAYRYALRITDGRITYDDPAFEVSGRVAANGAVRVVVRSGQREAVGTGRLSGDSGEGLWSGRSSSARCSGHWEAERRD
jgi:hypothetical protein